MTDKSNSPKSADNTSAADDILRQFHPELFHKRKLDAGSGKAPNESPVDTSANSASAVSDKLASPEPQKKVAKLHVKPKKQRQSLAIPSLGDLLYKFVNFFRDVIDWMASVAANSFLRYIINIYTVIAVIILVPAGYLGYKWWTKPPYFLADECYKCFTEVHSEFFDLRSANASQAEWEDFIEESSDEIEDMVYNLEHTSDVKQRERQVLKWMGGDYLLPMLKKRTGDISHEEEKFQEMLSEITRIRRDRDRSDMHIRY
ncbi:MAG: hypothetical protein KDA65_04165 [Planctomycetaceae bacterium]|nr:hypothetical protein [Planctomycetaceae bacterium]